MPEASMLDRIARERSGTALADQEIDDLIRSYTYGDMPDSRIMGRFTAVFFCGMDFCGIHSLTHSMLERDFWLALSKPDCGNLSKCSAAGVGNKISLVRASPTVDAGSAEPVISDRSLGFT